MWGGYGEIRGDMAAASTPERCPRCALDTPEIHPRYTRDTPEIHPRYTRAVPEQCPSRVLKVAAAAAAARAAGVERVAILDWDVHHLITYD